MSHQPHTAMVDPKPLRIVFAGAGEFGIPTLRAMVGEGHSVVQAVTQPDKPAGRGRGMTPTPIALEANELDLPLLKTADINAEQLPSADLLVVIAFGQKIAEPVIHAPRLGAINLHASILPRHRGAAPINWAILSGDDVAGNSVIRLAQKMDAGAVLGTSQTPIGPLETAGELHDRLSVDGAPLMLQVIRELAEGRAVETEQDPAAATLARKLSRQSTLLNFQSAAESLARQIRGLWPWPGCRVSLLDQDRKVASLRLVRGRPLAGKGEPGRISADGAIGTGDGVLQIVELQPDGKRPMTLEDYRRGHRWEAGLSVVSEA